jgi:hypothetical protein
VQPQLTDLAFDTGDMAETEDSAGAIFYPDGRSQAAPPRSPGAAPATMTNPAVAAFGDRRNERQRLPGQFWA